MSRTVLDDANDLYIPEGAGGAATINLGASFEPSGAGQYVRWEVEGDGAEPNSGTFAGGSPAVTLRPPPEGDRTYTVRVGLDDGQGGFVQGGCPVLELKVYVVKVASPLGVSGALPSNRDPSIYIAPEDLNARVEITATLVPDCPDEVARSLLSWTGDGLTDPNHPKKCWVPQNQVGSTPAQATVGGSSVGVTIMVVGVAADESTIWWFNGCDAQNYGESTALWARGVSAGEFRWVQSGAGLLVRFDNGMFIECVKVNDPYVGVESWDGSAALNDVSIQLFYDGVYCGEQKLTVRQPATAVVVDNPVDVDLSYPPIVYGYRTRYQMQVFDQFDLPMPLPVELNECFSLPDGSDWFGEDWSWGSAVGDMTVPATPDMFWDTYQVTSPPAWLTPCPTSPTDPDASSPVDWIFQEYRVGSTTPAQGVLVKTHIVHRYRGHARQE